MVPDRSVQHELYFDTSIAYQPDRRPYLLSLPRPAEELRAAGRKLPMIVYLHGIAAGGDDHRALYIEGIPRYLRDWPEYTAGHGYIFLAPVSVLRRRFMEPDIAAFTLNLIEHVRDTWPVDPDRVYLTGVSDGAIGTWALAAQRADLFAALAPVSGRMANPGLVSLRYRQLPAWISIGARDRQQMSNAFAMARAYAREQAAYQLDLIPEFVHVIWDQVYLEPHMYRWIDQWARGARRIAPPPDRIVRPAEAHKELPALRALYRIQRRVTWRRDPHVMNGFEKIMAEHPGTMSAHLAKIQHEAMSDDVLERREVMREHTTHAARELLRAALEDLEAGRRQRAVERLTYMLVFFRGTPAGQDAEALLHRLEHQ
jgi:pimeloyl-ACP methyl ester carboxylesterase